MSLPQRIKMTQIHLDQQREEFASLRKELEQARDSSTRNKMLLEEATQSATSHEQILLQLDERVQELTQRLKEKQEVAASLADEVELLAGSSAVSVPTNFKLSAPQGNLQELLDKVGSDLLCFRDSKGVVWEIAKA